MPRYPRNCLNTSFFHVMTQGINKTFIFDKSQDIEYYINKMRNLTKEQNVKILAYCIMSNHAHILIQTDKIDEMSKYMQRLNTSYGRYYNKKYDKVGFVFRNRYETEPIYNKNHLYNCIKYIADNPVKAGICRKAEEYPYSRYPKFNTFTEEEYSFIDTKESNEETIQKEIVAFLSKHNMVLKDLKNNKKELKELVVLLKDKYHFSFRKIAMEIEISKDIIWRIYNK